MAGGSFREFTDDQSNFTALLQRAMELEGVDRDMVHQLVTLLMKVITPGLFYILRVQCHCRNSIAKWGRKIHDTLLSSDNLFKGILQSVRDSHHLLTSV